MATPASLPHHPRHNAAHSTRLLLCLTLLLWGAHNAARAEIPGLRDWAEATVGVHSPARQGPLRPYPHSPSRPKRARLVARSLHLPLAVHATPEVPPRRIQAALAAAERAYQWLGWSGWQAPGSDGGRGGTAALDLYLAPYPEGAGAGYDVILQREGLDGASSFALVDPRVNALDACVASALAEASLLALDPGESRFWRRASAAWFAWQVSGEAGCPPALEAVQRQPSRGWFAAGPAGAALFLALLSDRQDGGRGHFLHALWQLARQRSYGHEGVRSSPSFWAALRTLLAERGEELRPLLVELDVARYFAGRGTPTYPSLRALPASARVPLEAELDRLPHRLEGRALHPYGSHHLLVHTRDATEAEQLRVWLRAAQGARWSLTAVRLDAEGEELGRVQTPPQRSARSYLPLALTPETETVLVVISCLPESLREHDPASLYEDAHAPEAQRDFAYRLILDRQASEPETR